MSSYAKWVIGLFIVLIAGVAVCHGTQGDDAVPTPPNVDSLKQANANLATRNQILLADVAQLTVQRDDLRRQNDSLKAASDSATKNIRADRAKLPAADAVLDRDVRESYAAALRQLDRAVAELGRKDEIIRRDSLARIKSDSVEADLRQLLANQTEMAANANKSVDIWFHEYEKQYRENHKRKCGKKCGIVIGVVGTVAAAIGVKKVIDLAEPPKP